MHFNYINKLQQRFRS